MDSGIPLSPPTQTERKDYRCDYCRQPILKGTKYNRSVWKDDYVYTWRVHKHCEDLEVRFKMFEDNEEGVDSDMFLEIIRFEYFKTNTEKVSISEMIESTYKPTNP